MLSRIGTKTETRPINVDETSCSMQLDVVVIRAIDLLRRAFPCVAFISKNQPEGLRIGNDHRLPLTHPGPPQFRCQRLEYRWRNEPICGRQRNKRVPLTYLLRILAASLDTL